MQKHEKLVLGIRDYFKKNNFKKAVIGLSGGLDSALAAILAARAIGPGNLTALLMPEEGVSGKAGINDASELANSLGIKTVLLPLNKKLAVFKKLPWKQSKLAGMNLRARLRAVMLYSYANSNKALVIGTGNKSELMLGYFTKHGDSAVDLLVIGSMWKTQVIEMARELGVNEKILARAPSAELSKGQSDEAELGACYPEIDPVLKLLSQGAGEREIIAKGNSAKLVKSLAKRVNKNMHKLKTAPIIRP